MKRFRCEHNITKDGICRPCGYETTRKGDLKSHLAFKHDIGVTWHKCDHCDYTSKQKRDLTRHLAFKHDIGVTLYKCDHCDYESKQKSNLKLHLATKHDIGVTWHECPHCDFKCKQKSNLKKHSTNKHDIGDHQCDYCACRHNSSIEYSDMNAGVVHICHRCFNKVTDKTNFYDLFTSVFHELRLRT
jgi:hypothetical protein